MQRRVFVLSKNRKPLMPCSPARARQLLKERKASVYRQEPFTIILQKRTEGDLQKVQLKFDPGSKITGIALVVFFQKGTVVTWAAELEHRGEKIVDLLSKRRAIRRSRRNRKTRYRPPRFCNRTRKKGWIAPSLKSKVDNIFNWTKKLLAYTPIDNLCVETNRFDTQKLQNPEISGVEYQQGTLFGYEIREYLLYKWNHQCVYCDAKNVALEIDHIHPRSKGGSNRVSNLTISCRKCNENKGNSDIHDFLNKDNKRLQKIVSYSKKTLRDAASINTTRYVIGNQLKKLGIDVGFASGGKTKANRRHNGFNKQHWIDAACAGESGENVTISQDLIPLGIRSQGRGSRQMCRVDQFGFPRTTAKSQKRAKGFQTGDIVKAVVTKGKKKGVYVGRVAVRSNGYFNIKTNNSTVQGISYRYCHLIQQVDGYFYFQKGDARLKKPSCSCFAHSRPSGDSSPTYRSRGILATN
ncbi:HNH endonuclease [Candidatus Uabimicrobium amorphum]|uniref:HNH endonuclease n=1 Tax=Uabimicrobium amorphum TaxID=2596890 RepID=A0A5S9F499_UABAM|nr:RNA-guided endonuclease IscB [Candidatus Uabimicrobium amorphum]BBM84012.1 HNH endonuclease [Candidatus Uabimicrobium amorphum]